MLEGTKEQIQLLIAKIGVLDHVLQGLSLNHKDNNDEIEKQYRMASYKKLILSAEVLRLVGADVLPERKEKAEAKEDLTKV